MIGQLISSQCQYDVVRGSQTLVEVRIIPSEDIGAVVPANAWLRAADNDLPQINSFHPLSAYNTLSLIDREVTPIEGAKAVYARLTWQYRPPYSLRMSATLRAMQTNLALDPSDVIIPIITTENEADPTGHLVDVMVPEFSFTFEGRYLTQIIHPLELQFHYAGKTNSLAWPLPGLDPPGTWLCTSVDVPEYLVGLTFYKAVMSFAYREEGWQTTVVHQDESNQPIADPMVGTTLQTYDLYTATDFSPLGIFA